MSRISTRKSLELVYVFSLNLFVSLQKMPSNSKSEFGFLAVVELPELEHTIKSPCSQSGFKVTNCHSLSLEGQLVGM